MDAEEAIIGADEPCGIIADLLSSALLRAYEGGRDWLYIWETRGCVYLLDRIDDGTYEGNMWTSNFVRLNRDVLRSGHTNPKVSYNLRAFREAEEKSGVSSN